MACGSLGLSVSRSLGLSVSRSLRCFDAREEDEAPARRGGFACQPGFGSRAGYFFPFFAAFFAGFARRGPGFAMLEGRPSEATSAK